MPLKSIQLDTIRLDGNCQPPGRLGEDEVTDYTEQMKDGRWDWDRSDDPIVVFEDGGDKWLAHGHHRYHAARRAGLVTIECLVRTGTQADAQEFAAGCNKQSSRRRSNADKQWAIDTVLRLHSGWSDAKIAAHVGVSDRMVASRRNPESFGVERVGTDGKKRKLPQRGAKFHNPNPMPPSGPPPAPPRKDEQCQSGQYASSASQPSASQPSSTTPSSQSATTDPANDAISRAGEIKQFANDVFAMKRRLASLKSDPLGACLNFQYIETALTNAAQAIKNGTPHAPCPNQPNCASGRCTACKGRGWLNERDFEEAKRVLGEAA